MCPCEILDFKCQRFHQSCQIKFNMPKNRSSSPSSSSALMDAAPQKKHRRRRGGIPWMNNKFASIAFRGVCFYDCVCVCALSRGFLIKFHKHIIYAFFRWGGAASPPSSGLSYYTDPRKTKGCRKIIVSELEFFFLFWSWDPSRRKTNCLLITSPP